MKKSEVLTLQAAVKELRSRKTLTQRELADLVGRETASIARYESTMPPTGEALTSLTAIAVSSGYEDLAEVFWEALAHEMGPSIDQVIDWRANPSEKKPKTPAPESEIEILVQRLRRFYGIATGPRPMRSEKSFLKWLSEGLADY